MPALATLPLSPGGKSTTSLPFFSDFGFQRKPARLLLLLTGVVAAACS